MLNDLRLTILPYTLISLGCLKLVNRICIQLVHKSSDIFQNLRTASDATVGHWELGKALEVGTEETAVGCLVCQPAHRVVPAYRGICITQTQLLVLAALRLTIPKARSVGITWAIPAYVVENHHVFA
jgi:hypothetical protein